MALDHDRLRRWLQISVAAFLLSLATHGNFSGSGDAVHYMMIAHSIAFDRDLDVANDYADPGNLIQGGRLQHEAHARPGRGGVLRPVHDVGLPLVAAPYFVAAYLAAEHLTDRLPEAFRLRARLDRWIMLRQLVGLGMILTTCALAGLFFDASLEITSAPGASFAGALLFSLSPPILSHSHVFFTEVPSALLAFWAYRALRSAGGRFAGGLLPGLATGFLLLVHVRNLGLVIGLALLAWGRLWRERPRAMAFAAGVAAMVAARTALNFHLWGTFVTTPHAHVAPWPGFAAMAAAIGQRAMGLLLDQKHGLLLYAPLYLLAPAGWLVLRRRFPEVARELLLPTGAYLLFVLLPTVNVHGWRGGWSPAARFLVPIAPFLALPVVSALAATASRVVTGAIVVLQGLLDLFFWGHPMLLWNDDTGSAAFLRALGGDSLAACFPTWDPVSARDLGISILALAAWAVLTAWLARK
jgi:hypothetical protein